MKKGLAVLSLITMFAACGKKEETPKVEVSTPITAEQVVEEKKIEEVAPVVEETIVTENKASEIVENVEESVVADIVETTSGEVSTTEEIVVVEDKLAQ